jgi:KaiC/GvpD/RAD55 family RecA-like ATPase
MKNAARKTPRTEPLRQAQARKSSRASLFLNLCDLDALTVKDWILPGLFMRDQVSALVGDKSTNKTSIAICFATMKAYGDPWHDGTEISPGAVLYVVGEGLSGMRYRRRAALRVLGKAEPEHLTDFFKIVDPRAANLNLLDAESVASFVSAVREQMQQEGSRLDLVFLDTLSALIGDESPRSIVTFVRHMRQIAEELNCHVCALHHTQRGTNQYRGPGQLGGNLDALFVSIRETRDRTLLYVEKQREGEAGFSFVFDRSVVTLGIDEHSKPITSVAVALAGTIADDNSALNHDGYRRKQIAEAMQPDQRLSVSAVVRLLKWSKDGYGGVQHGWVDDAIPEDEWIAVQVADGAIRELRRSRQGAVSYVECRNAEMAGVPLTGGAHTGPMPEPEHEPAPEPQEPVPERRQSESAPHEAAPAAQEPVPELAQEDARYRLADRRRTLDEVKNLETRHQVHKWRGPLSHARQMRADFLAYLDTLDTVGMPAVTPTNPAAWAELDGAVADDLIARYSVPLSSPDPEPTPLAPVPEPEPAAPAASALEASSGSGGNGGRDAVTQDIARMLYGRLSFAKITGSPSALMVEAHDEDKKMFLRASLKAHPEVEDQFALEIVTRHVGRYIVREHPVELADEQAKIATIDWDIVVGPEKQSDLVTACKIAKADKEKTISLDVIDGKLSIVPAQWCFARQDLEWVLRKDVSVIRFSNRGVLAVTARGTSGDYEFLLRGIES